MDAAHCLDLSLPPNFITMLLQSMSLSDRFTCALVCKAWAEAATAVTNTITLKHREDLSCLQAWLQQHGGQLKVLQLHECRDAALAALPCPHFQDLLLRGLDFSGIRIDARVWRDIAAATKLTSVTLKYVSTASQQADVVSALTALPDLQQLTWSSKFCGGQLGLTDSVLLQNLTKLTALRIGYVEAAEFFEHVGMLTRLQDLSFDVAADWAAAGWPGLQELKALTRLQMPYLSDGISASLNQLTALQRLSVFQATPTALNKLSALTGLTQLYIDQLIHLSSASPPVQLPGLQHLEVASGGHHTAPVSFLASCTQLRLLKLRRMNLSPGSLAASTMLQHLQLQECSITAADEAADPVSWQQLFPGPGWLPHLTSLQVTYSNHLQHADIECVVACCSSLQVLHLDSLPDNCGPALACLPGLTSLALGLGSDQQCSSTAQLTGLRGLKVTDPRETTVAGLVQLAALKDLTRLCFGYAYSGSKVKPTVWRQMSDKVPNCMFAILNKVCGGGGHGYGYKQHSSSMVCLFESRV